MLLRTLLIGIVFVGTAAAAMDPRIVENTPDSMVVRLVSTYRMGDGESPVDARRLALEEGKRLAAELAGTYVQSDLVVENDRIAQSTITTLSAGFLSTVVLEEKRSLTEDGRLSLTLHLEATLDKKELRERVERLKDPELVRQLESVQEENEKLQSRLSELSALSATAPDPEIVARRAEILADIERNQGRVRKIFEKKTLLDLARAGEMDYLHAKDELLTRYWEKMAAMIRIDLGIPQFGSSSDGTYELRLPYSYHLATREFLPVLERHFRVVTRSNGQVAIHPRPGEPNSERLFREVIANRKVSLELGMGLRKEIQDLFPSSSIRPGGAGLFVVPGLSDRDIERLDAFEARLVIDNPLFPGSKLASKARRKTAPPVASPRKSVPIREEKKGQTLRDALQNLAPGVRLPPAPANLAPADPPVTEANRALAKLERMLADKRRNPNPSLEEAGSRYFISTYQMVFLANHSTCGEPIRSAYPEAPVDFDEEMQKQKRMMGPKLGPAIDDFIGSYTWRREEMNLRTQMKEAFPALSMDEEGCRSLGGIMLGDWRSREKDFEKATDQVLRQIGER